MIEILPAIIPESFEDLKEKVASVSYFASVVHVDVLDGRFVPAKSWPHAADMEAFDTILSELNGLPQWETIDYEVDLMVADPVLEVERWIRAGVRRAIVHIESLKNPEELLNMLITKHRYNNTNEFDGFEIGIAIGIDTPIEAIDSLINKVHFVQCMGIRQIGYQGQPFDERVLTRIAELRAKYPQLVIVGDGGVTLENSKDWVKAGANRLVSGSAIYQSENIHETIEELRTLDEKIKAGLI